MTRLELQWEPLDRLIADGVEDLLAAHWEEVALDKSAVALAPDWPKARELERIGILKTLAMRREGVLIGYNAFLITPHLHYRQILQAVNDVIYLDPAERGSAGVRLIRGTEALLRELGVQRILYHTKLHVLLGRRKQGRVGDLLERLGYSHVENIHAKLLE
jgi:hypothetical protein